MNKCLTRLVLTTVFLFGLTLSSSSAEAQIFGADDEDLKKIYFDLKKLNAHLAEAKNQILDKIDQQNKNLELFRQDMEKFEQNNKGIKAVLAQDLIPALRNENNKTRQSMLDEIEKLKFSQHLAEVKNQVLDEIHQQNKILQLFRQEQANLIEKLKFSQNRLEGKLDELLRKIGFEKLESWDIYK